MGSIVDLAAHRRLRDTRSAIDRITEDVGRLRAEIDRMNGLLAPAEASLAEVRERCRVQVDELRETLDFCEACRVAGELDDIDALERERDRLAARFERMTGRPRR